MVIWLNYGVEVAGVIGWKIISDTPAMPDVLNTPTTTVVPVTGGVRVTPPPAVMNKYLPSWLTGTFVIELTITLPPVAYLTAAPRMADAKATPTARLSVTSVLSHL